MKIDVDFEIFGILAFYSAILLAKILVMPVLVAKQRINKKVSVSVDESTCSGSTAATDSSEVLQAPFSFCFFFLNFRLLNCTTYYLPKE